MHGRDEKYLQNFSQKAEGKRPLERLRCTQDNNIKTNINEMGCEGIHCMTFVNMIMSFHVSLRVGTS
jgi:hypothetical protein